MESPALLWLNWRSVMMVMVVAPIILCSLVLLTRRTETNASRALGLGLILAVFSMGPQIIGFAGAYKLWPWLTFFPPFYADLLIGPLLIIHAHALIRGGGLGWRWWLFVPGAVQVLYYLCAFTLPGNGVFDHLAKWDYSGTYHSPYIVPFESLLGIGLLLFAMVYLWRERRAYLHFLENTSSAARDYDPVWLRNVGLALLLASAIYAGIELWDFIAELSYIAAFPFQVCLMAVLCWLGLDAAWRLTSPFPKLKPHAEDTVPAPDDLAARIMTRMRDSHWYLEPRLSIRDVAGRMGTNESYVSRALNRATGQSFNRLVNGLRVDHAKTQLSKTSASVLTIAMESGFNSKATFNRVFRERTDQTPTQFRASQKP